MPQFSPPPTYAAARTPPNQVPQQSPFPQQQQQQQQQFFSQPAYSPPQYQGGFESNNQAEEDEYANEPPLLEELGINVGDIIERIKGVALFRRVKDAQDHSDWDIGGPLAILTVMCIFLMLAGKVHFGYIYGVGIVGCTGAWLLVNAISPKGGIDLFTTISILGYGLLPTVLLAAAGVVMRLQSTLGAALSLITVMWCTATASRFFEVGVDLDNQRWLVAYPIGLIYVCFAILTVF